jgi:hypothetical protein
MIIRQFLEASSVMPSFREALLAFLESGAPNERISFAPYSPPVKVERTLTKLLEVHSDLAIERVEIDGRSGCEFYRGHLEIHTADSVRHVRFHWDCKWRAQQEGWSDYFGFPDQIRAARECGYDCFREWAEVTPAAEVRPAVLQPVMVAV